MADNPATSHAWRFGLWAMAVLAVALIAFAPVSASAETPPACTGDARVAATRLIARWVELAGKADADALAALYAGDAVLSTGNPPEEFRGTVAIAGQLHSLLARHPMGSVTEAMVAEDCNRVSGSGRVLLRVTGRRKGTRMLLAGRFQIVAQSVAGQWRIARHDLLLDPRPNRAGGKLQPGKPPAK